MPIKIIDHDILKIKSGYIFHQVNCMGKMGKGIALDIRNMYPKVYEIYKEKCKSSDILGTVDYIAIDQELTICNLYSQYRYGLTKRHTDYKAMLGCFNDVLGNIAFGSNIFIPYKMGCVNAGGDWEIVYKLIEAKLSQNYNVIICKK